MPELPDVEGFRRVLADHGEGHRIARIRVVDDGVLHGTTAQELGRALKGRTLGAPERLGKWLIGRTDGEPAVLLHFGMTGQLLWCEAGESEHRHDRVVFQLDDGELRYRDMRKLQGLRLARDGAELEEALADQGPDALSIGRGDFDELVARSSRKLKAHLSDQSALAGLGNLTIDEILWRARIYPNRKASGLSDDERKRVYSDMRRVLRDSVPTGQVPPRKRWLTGVRDDAPGAPCPRCGTGLAKERLSGRSTVYCPNCQPEAS